MKWGGVGALSSSGTARRDPRKASGDLKKTISPPPRGEVSLKLKKREMVEAVTCADARLARMRNSLC